ncbi:type II secretion system F family protein [Clostridium beijerinckii]|jgi:type IV pilus assembly protein PilC|uniref:Type II secretion system F family protein n=1 Tax=Clostridium beijerinckii TaxID=1520 RepID=A0A7X9SK73_CLOBE|nr:type II secretion system F family protein [Clostridium beijerinckii]MCI1477995.1 type II secretion system F family protein [Clostridium beijerinckii]MCI1578375.1 type II secretion system F family protein [Clostridium beijerinckii]MCI1584127.1 type II secretion system F family protein [Clostridium beijerinckii]MCI1621692.1 type II secretion system F family protein [Clostridium beijerinckii]NMF03345.1 type II secretion system F family protein [Clostridium beijerinckii]
MAKFKYRAMNSNREKIVGTHEADSKNEVIDYISSNGYYPLKVEEVVTSANVEIKLSKKVTLKDIAVFCRQFYTMLNSGVPILTCLDILSKQVQNQKLRNAVIEIKGDIERGGVLSDSMKKHLDVFPELLVNLIGSGEASGTLESIMLRMSSHYEKENKINNKVKNAMIYPIILSIVAFSSVTFILTYVMPTFMSIFEQTGTKLPWTTILIINLSNFLKNNIIEIVITIALISIILGYYSKTENGQLLGSKLRLKLPILKKLNQMIIVSRFTRTLSTLLASGLSLIESLKIVSTVVGNKIAESAVLKVRENVISGESIYSSMLETNIFPEMLSSMIKIGEETGALDDILNKTADFYDDELEETIQLTVSLMEPILIVVMGIVIGFVIISIMVPMFDAYSKI